ncbi:Serine/threonine-protein phosphatase PP1 [Tritrichomonas foetus]|uniref:Serine/threonine-protein phosphatase n=1 Tax=Tritrichomonas foetus TaxID=1144522 RepID=A0A1J4J945_9EUKA|nr:Serine/threonine-protein phosphatase PP1 [Tritrichomonas foetus]|eukprot:OHS93933.1 Serine/threonine-protein phosphatase PP1 [Tritrichomonas foetus]
MLTHKRLDEIIDEAMNGNSKNAGFTPELVHQICNDAREEFLAEDSLLRIQAPINICGDLHGHFADLIKALKVGGTPPMHKWLFLGDYVDRGNQGLEIVCLLFSLKLRYPNQIFLLRGNHETEEISGNFGFLEECRLKMNKNVWTAIDNVFDTLPIGALINTKIFCIHGGISPHLKDVNQIDNFDRPIKVPKNGLLTDLLWSDPDSSHQKFGDSPRGNTVTWGPKVANKFMTKNGLKMIVRGHQIAEAGYDYPFYPEKNVVTLFTSSSKLGKNPIDAAIMRVNPNLTVSFTILPVEIPQNRIPRRSSALNLPLETKSSISSSQYNFSAVPRSNNPRMSLSRSRRCSGSFHSLRPTLPTAPLKVRPLLNDE